MFWFSDNGFKKKAKVGRVFISCFYFQSNMRRVFIFCFYFQRFKNITQTNLILLFWQTNNTRLFEICFHFAGHRSITQEFSAGSSEFLPDLPVIFYIKLFLSQAMSYRYYYFSLAERFLYLTSLVLVEA